MVLLGGYGLGSIVTFRYLSPTAHDRQPLIMLLTDRHADGNMHGINLRYITPLQQQQLQHYFQPPGRRQEDHINPFQQQRVDRYQEKMQREEELRQQQLQQEEGYVIRPEPGNMFGVATFTRTIRALAQRARGAIGYLRKYIPFGGPRQPPPEPEQPSPFADVSQETMPVIDNPTTFYYQYAKPILKEFAPNAYRKYKPQYVQNLRIINGVLER